MWTVSVAVTIMEGVVKMLALCAACLLFVAPLHEFEGERALILFGLVCCRVV